MGDPAVAPIAELRKVGVTRGGNEILRDISVRIDPGQHWLLLGPNGSGKTTLISLLSGHEHPTTGTVELLGHQVGRTDLRVLRRRIGLASPLLSRQLRAGITAEDVVVSGYRAALETWWHTYTDAERLRAGELLDKVGLSGAADREIRTLSSGEMRQVEIARALVSNPELLLLDEPAAGLDLGAREELLQRLGELLAPRSGLGPVVLVTHHLEEVPAHMTHALLLRNGSIVSRGPISDVVTDDTVSECFGLSLTVSHVGERWSCIAR